MIKKKYGMIIDIDIQPGFGYNDPNEIEIQWYFLPKYFCIRCYIAKFGNIDLTQSIRMAPDCFYNYGNKEIYKTNNIYSIDNHIKRKHISPLPKINLNYEEYCSLCEKEFANNYGYITHTRYGKKDNEKYEECIEEIKSIPKDLQLLIISFLPKHIMMLKKKGNHYLKAI